MPNLKDHFAVILCGGRGTRMGHLTEDRPKPMVEIGSKPIIGHIIEELYKSGFRKFIFPLGYQGSLIKKYVEGLGIGKRCEIHLIDTGPDSPIALRLKCISPLIAPNGNFLLLNGDAIFEFNLLSMLKSHKKTNAWLTLASVNVFANYGLIFEKKGRVIDFKRDFKVKRYCGDERKTESFGYIYSGISWLNSRIFDHFDFQRCPNYEEYIFPELIKMGKVNHWMSDGFWLAIDTPQDLYLANQRLKTGKNNFGRFGEMKTSNGRY